MVANVVLWSNAHVLDQGPPNLVAQETAAVETLEEHPT